MALPERFDLDPFQRRLFLAAPWVSACLAVLFACLPFIPDDGARTENEHDTMFLAVIFGVATWFAWRIARAVPETSISVDEEGLWPTIKDREQALVPWSAIVALRERDGHQRLEAINAAGMTVAKLEYQLTDFGRLRAIALQRAHLKRPATSSVTYRKSAWYHVLTIGTAVSIAVAGLVLGYSGETEPLLAFFQVALIDGMILWEYAKTPFRLDITPGALEIHAPGRREHVPRGRVAAVGLEDEILRNFVRHPHVTLQLVGSDQPLHLTGLGVGAVELQRVLQTWHKGGARFEPDAAMQTT